MRARIAVLLGVLALGLAPGARAQRETRVALGILPTHDASGESQGGTLTRALPEMIFSKLTGTRVEPVFLNPGGTYSPLDEEWYSEYSRLMKVDAVLVTSLVGRARRTGNLEVESFLLNLRTGQKSPKLTATGSINKKDLQRARAFEGAGFFGPNRSFEKLGLGKATRRLAAALATIALDQIGSLVESGTAPVTGSGSGSCDVKMRVRYTEKGSASKSYILILNGREESLGIIDGVVSTRLASGPVVAHVSVKDPPYKVPVQDSYSANTFLDCGRPERTLVLEIGPIGQAFLKWSP